MDRTKEPYQAQDPTQVANVLRAMKDPAKSRKGVRYRSKTFNISDKSGRTVDSWQLNDWDYKRSDLPTYARGLFTRSNNGKPEIAVRGYDKFFNVNEVSKTEWPNIEQNTRGPYELSVKENGCIIFIAGFDDSTLLVTSKHSTGPRDNNSANHAFAGEAWVEHQLKAIGKTKADLAKRLRAMNATAVAELCDDDFEEHVLQYNPDQAGLYLHGINLNLPEFATYPGTLVDKFADEWGFRKVMYVMENDIRTVKAFLDGVAETGNYQGRDTEGFVIRCQARDSPAGEWHDWFFKYKFEEPYLMYRQWREATRAVIAGRLPKYKKHKEITDQYVIYARRQLANDPSLSKRFNQNHGIIALRDAFLAEKGLKGSDIIRREQEGGTSADSVVENVVLVPVATIGCGKTTVALALTKLFNWGHEQNDNIVGKGSRPQRFAVACINSIATHPVLFADRNNHQRREREQIIKDIQKVIPDAKFVALHWVHDQGDYDEIKKAMRERVLSRGDNHQTIQAGSKGPQEIIGIMDGFMSRFEPVNPEKPPDDDFDAVIDLDVTATSRQNLETVIYKLHGEYPKLFTIPTEAEMDEAFSWALHNYQPEVKHDLSNKRDAKRAAKQTQRQQTGQPDGSEKKAQKFKGIEYFGIFLPGSQIVPMLDAIFKGESAETAQFYNQLRGSRRLQSTFHVTLIHKASMSEHGSYWGGLNDLWRKKQDEAREQAQLVSGTSNNGDLPLENLELGKARVTLDRIVWDGRVMTISVRLPDADRQGGGFKSVNAGAHITIGTADDKIKPKESNDLLARWMSNGESMDSQTRIRDIKIPGQTVLEGSVKAIHSR